MLIPKPTPMTDGAKRPHMSDRDNQHDPSKAASVLPMTEDELKREKTHFAVKPENRRGRDRRKVNCFIQNDRRSGVACRRKAKQLEKDRQRAVSQTVFHPEYFRID